MPVSRVPGPVSGSVPGDLRLSHVLRDLARTLHTDLATDDVLRLLTERLVDLLGLDGAAVSFRAPGARAVRVVGSGPDAIRWHHLQLTLDQGPCSEAERTRTTVEVPDVGSVVDHARVVEASGDVAPGSVAAFPLLVEGVCHGVLGLYGPTGRRLTTAEEEAVDLLVEVTLAYVHNAEVREVQADFVAAASYELRSPLTSITGHVELLLAAEAGPLNPGQDQFVQAISRSSERLTTLARDLIELTGLETRPARHVHADVDLRKTLLAAQFALERVVASRRLALDFEVPTANVLVHGDAAQLESVVTNLVGNAVKFTPDGGSVRCGLETSGPRAVVTVVDTGLGIPEAEQAELFTRFFRSSTAREHGIPGSGLGLSIVRRIVEEHGGRVHLTSAHLAGSTFTVELPLVTPADTPGQD